MPACGCVFHSSCARVMTERSRYQMTPPIAVRCLFRGREPSHGDSRSRDEGQRAPLGVCNTRLAPDSTVAGPTLSKGVRRMHGVGRTWALLALAHLRREKYGERYPPFVRGLPGILGFGTCAFCRRTEDTSGGAIRIHNRSISANQADISARFTLFPALPPHVSALPSSRARVGESHDAVGCNLNRPFDLDRHREPHFIPSCPESFELHVLHPDLRDFSWQWNALRPDVGQTSSSPTS